METFEFGLNLLFAMSCHVLVEAMDKILWLGNEIPPRDTGVLNPCYLPLSSVYRGCRESGLEKVGHWVQSFVAVAS